MVNEKADKEFWELMERLEHLSERNYELAKQVLYLYK